MSFLLALQFCNAFLAFGIIGAIVFFASGASRSNKAHITDQGIIGEERLGAELRAILSEDYTAIYNVPMNDEDIDCVVIGPSGVYAFEAKNHRGEITYNEGGWSQVKVGRGGTEYKGHLSNPTGQLGRYIRQLRGVLEKEGIRHWINGYIVFTNPEASLYITAEMKNIKAVSLNELAAVFPKGKKILDPEKKKIINAVLRFAKNQ